MAWRIDEAVVRGEIDNRVRGRTTGCIWFAGRAEPVVLDLAGDCWRDLAGRRLEFENPDPRPGDLRSFATRQSGSVGDITASRKVKVPDVPMDEVMELIGQEKPFPWHWGNSLYLEWFSDANGRVVIESATFRLTMSPDIAWDMTPEEEETQRRANAGAMGGFLEDLGEAAEADAAKDRGEEKDGLGENRPQTEEEAERMLADSDALADRIQARLDREGRGADYEKILNEELERRARERGEKPLTPEEEAERAEWIEEMNRAGAEALEEAKAEEWKPPAPDHPTVQQASALAVRLIRDTESRGWLLDDAGAEHPVAELARGAMAAAAKFASGLGGDDWPPDRDECAGRIARLKRARGYLDDALRAAEDCAEQGLTERAWLASIMAELRALAASCDEFIAELRERLAGE